MYTVPKPIVPNPKNYTSSTAADALNSGNPIPKKSPIATRLCKN